MSNNSHKSQAPQGYNPHAEIDRALHATRAVIEEAIGYIERQEDGPLTMRFALSDIADQVDALETEAIYALGTIDELNKIMLGLQHQRDDAIQQYEMIIGLFGLPDYREDQA